MVTSKASDVWEMYADKLNSGMYEFRAPFDSGHLQCLKMLKGDMCMD